MEIDMIGSLRKRPKAQNGTIEYELEEFQPIKDVSFFVYGTCDIDYELDYDDPDVGYHGGLGFSVTRISINGDSKDKPALNLDSSSELYKMIEKRLVDDCFWINEAIFKDLESNYLDPDYDRD
jgi:hypothetical protein